MFRKLCGDNTLRNVVVVTNMWGEVSPQVGAAREAELMSEDIFFKPVLKRGGQMARHNNTVASAESIIRRVLNNRPLPLRIQVELVSERKDISKTSAGKELNRELNAQIRKHQEEIRIIKKEMEQVMKDKDERTRTALEIEAKRMQEEIERLKDDAKRFSSGYKRERDRLEAHIVHVEAKARQEADRVATQYQQQIDELRASLQANAAASERDRALMAQKIDELSKKRDSARRHPWISVVEFMADQFLRPR